MPAVTLRQLLEAGVHFGHQTSRWNPQMRPYIFTARNGIHIIDLEQTQKQLDVACEYLRDIVGSGQKVLFVGTKKQAQDVIEEVCHNTGQAYVTHRWMGGMLTNFTVIQRRLRRLAELRVMQSKGDFERMSGKEANDAKDDLERLENNFAGMADMKRLPGAVFVIDCKKERIAVTEANKLEHPDRRDRGHQLRPGRHPGRDPGQRRRHAELPAHRERDRQGDRRGAAAVQRARDAGAPGSREARARGCARG